MSSKRQSYTKTNRLRKMAGSFKEKLSSLHLSRAPTPSSIEMDSSSDNINPTRISRLDRVPVVDIDHAPTTTVGTEAHTSSPPCPPISVPISELIPVPKQLSSSTSAQGLETPPTRISLATHCPLSSTLPDGVMQVSEESQQDLSDSAPEFFANAQNVLITGGTFVFTSSDNFGKPYSGFISFLGRHMFSMFLFSAPDVHLEYLQKMWVDRILHKAVWEEGLKKVIEEWQEFILHSTIILNANVAFLSIQSMDTNSDPYRSPTQISSYCSITASIGSIIIGVFLVRQSRKKHRETASEMQKFLAKWTHPLLGLETLAIMFSLPYALLMWSMVSFLMAFIFMCLQNSDVVTCSATLLGIILILTFWCLKED